MDTYNGIQIYTRADFPTGTTLREARCQLERTATLPSLIVFERQIAGVRIRVAEHTRTMAEILSALLPQAE